MRNILLLTILLGNLSLFSQSRDSNSTYAVVVGISNYQDDAITDLKYADKDAKAFANFLRSPAGGSLDDDHLIVLTNEQATTGGMVSALDWLIENCQEKDQAIIYFSGHGDVEQKTAFQLGFLLTWDSPAKAYAAGAFHLYYLQAIISTLSTENKAKVLIITDACRSGNLAGNAIGGNQLTSANLARQYANEVKILSCQQDEVSIEGKQWGGGRGAFSYHLIDGLYGMADRDDNLMVDLMEIGRYLEDHVTTEVAPLKQIPMTVGNRGEKLANVSPEILAKIIKGKKAQDTPFASVVSKGLEDDVLAKLDPELRKMYLTFKGALKEKYFLATDQSEGRDVGKSADELYTILSKETKLKPLYNLMKRNFAASLQDKSQQAILRYLNVDPEEMKERYKSYGRKYKSFPLYLAKATELLGTEHYMYKHLKAKQYYFEGLLYRLQGDKDVDATFYELAIERLELALQNNNRAAYILNEMGYNHQRIGINKFRDENWREKNKAWKRAIPYFDSTLAIAPTWTLPLVNSTINYRMLRKFDKSNAMILKVLEIDSTNYFAYGYLGDNLKRQNKNEEALKMFEKQLSHTPNDRSPNYSIATLYNKLEKYDQAIPYFKTVISIDPDYYFGYSGLASSYSSIKQHNKAIINYEKAISINPKGLGLYSNLAYQNMYLKQFKKAKEKLDHVNILHPGHYEYHFGMACWHSLQGHVNEALPELELAIKDGLPYKRIESDSDINNLRNNSQFKSILNKYFPDQSKK